MFLKLSKWVSIYFSFHLNEVRKNKDQILLINAVNTILMKYWGQYWQIDSACIDKQILPSKIALRNVVKLLQHEQKFATHCMLFVVSMMGFVILQSSTPYWFTASWRHLLNTIQESWSSFALEMHVGHTNMGCTSKALGPHVGSKGRVWESLI